MEQGQQPQSPPDGPPDWKGVVGIQNMGNTCYANTTLQLLRACPEWTVFCLTNSIADRTQHLPAEDPHRRILLAYHDILCSLWSAYRPAYVRPVGFLTEVRKAVTGTPYESFGLPVPNDSHEYLVYLLDHFHEALRKEIEWSPTPIPAELPAPDRMRLEALQAWYRFVTKNNSPIVHFFFGMMRKTTHCQTCQTATHQWEVFNSLKIPCEGVTFEEWIEKEANERSEIEGYRCDTCKEKRNALRTSHLWQLPTHLFVTLRRFHFHQKIMTPCPYQGQPITFTRFFAPESTHESRDFTYELRATSDHHGTNMGGHYTAQFCHPLTGQWWKMDDTHSQPLPAPVFGPSNYIFYLRRRG
jgi:ubiquitin carboxyl-terminal hydrolase 2/21